MPRLSCKLCDWESEYYDRLSKTVREAAEAHAKSKHHVFYRFYKIEDHVIEECFKAVSG